MMGGPMVEARMTKLTTTMPTTARRFRRRRFHASFHSDVPTTGSVPDAGIDESVSNVHHQVEDQHDDRYERHDADDERLVAIQVGVDEIVAESRQREDALDDHGTG